MRISDWSSDVCSSDRLFRAGHPEGSENEKKTLASIPLGRLGSPADVAAAVTFLLGDDAGYITGQVLGDRKSVVSGQSVSVRVDIGGSRIIKKTLTPIRLRFCTTSIPLVSQYVS